MLLFLATIEDHEDRTKIEQIYNLYSKKLYQIAFAVLQNTEDAEDAVQTAMLNTCKHVKKLQDPKDRDTMWYVMRATKNAAINIYNKKKNRWNKEEPYDDTFISIDSSEMFNEGSELSRRILELTPRDRDILMLKYVQGYDYSEIAQILKMSKEAAKRAGARAKKRLEEAIRVEEAYNDGSAIKESVN